MVNIGDGFLRTRASVPAVKTSSHLGVNYLLINYHSYLRSEIASQQYNFNRDETEVAEIKSITKQEILDFYDTFISAKSPQRRKIAAHVISTIEEPDSEATNLVAEDSDAELRSKPVLVQDVVVFKAAHPIWPLAKPYKKLNELTRNKLINGEANCH